MKNKYIFISAFLFAIIMITSCGDCPITEQPPVFSCNVREGTISEFNPRFNPRQVGDSIYLEPVPKYSIHTFEFPSSNSSSGNLPNDERYVDNERIPIIPAIKFFNQDYFAAIVDYYPANSTMIGDVMVVNVNLDSFNPLESTADIKVFGSISRFPDNFYSENSDEFCEFISSYSQEELNNLRIGAQLYGAFLPNSTNINYDDNNFVVLDNNGKIIPGLTVPLAEKQQLLQNLAGASVTLRIRIGEVYFYRARNGLQFVFVVADIRPGTQPPNKNRVTLMFNPLK